MGGAAYLLLGRVQRLEACLPVEEAARNHQDLKPRKPLTPPRQPEAAGPSKSARPNGQLWARGRYEEPKAEARGPLRRAERPVRPRAKAAARAAERQQRQEEA